MRIAWFTPLWRNSAIGSFSTHVTEVLARFATVELWIPETVDAQPTALPVVRFDRNSLDRSRLAHADIAVYNIGNNLPFHQEIMAVARTVPGIVVLHDTVLHHFFLDEARFGVGRPDPYFSAMERWYGEEAADRARAHLGDTPFIGYPPDDFTAEFPLLEEATLGALGVVVHSDDQMQRVNRYWAGPIRRLDLPGRDAELAITPPRQPAGAKDGRLQLLSFGLVGGPKQIHLVLDALAARPDLRDRVRYTVAGPYDPESEYFTGLVQRVDDHDLGDAVEFLGYVSDEVLGQLSARTDAFVNLRWPSTEGGSASLVQQLLSGRPVVVSRSGIFDEIPEDAAVKIDSQDAPGVAGAIDRLLDGPAYRGEVGAAGRKFARHFTAEAYVRGILTVAEEALRWSVPLRMLDRVGDTLRDLGAGEGMAVLDTVGAEIAQMFGPSFTQSGRLE